MVKAGARKGDSTPAFYLSTQSYGVCGNGNSLAGIPESNVCKSVTSRNSAGKARGDPYGVRQPE